MVRSSNASHNLRQVAPDELKQLSTRLLDAGKRLRAKVPRASMKYSWTLPREVDEPALLFPHAELNEKQYLILVSDSLARSFPELIDGAPYSTALASPYRYFPAGNQPVINLGSRAPGHPSETVEITLVKWDCPRDARFPDRLAIRATNRNFPGYDYQYFLSTQKGR